MSREILDFQGFFTFFSLFGNHSVILFTEFSLPAARRAFSLFFLFDERLSPFYNEY